MYGYPEQFIPAPELIGVGPVPAPAGATASAGLNPSEVPGMKLVIAYIRHEAFEPIRMELLELGFPSMSITEVKGSGPPEGHHRAVPRLVGDELPAAEDQDRVRRRHGDVQTIVDSILRHARTGSIGDGKVFVIPVEQAYRIRTGESGEETLQAHPDAAAAV